MDAVSISVIVISVIGAIGSLVSVLHLKKCHSGCCDSECVKGNTPASTPTTKPLISDISFALNKEGKRYVR
jgi:hypothetical protein